MPSTRKYYYYRGKKLFITPSNNTTSVCFKSGFPKPLKIDDYPNLISYSPGEELAIFNLSENKTRKLFANEDKDLAIYPVYTYSNAKYSAYPPLVFNSRYFVRFADYVEKSEVLALCKRYDSVVLERIEGKTNLYLLQHANRGAQFLSVVNDFYEHNKEVVLYAHPDFVNGLRYEAAPNLFALQKPALDQLKIIESWNAIAAHPGMVLPEIKIAVLDEGIKHKHPDLGAGVVPQFFDYYANYQPRPYNNANYHGTAVAGIIAAVHTNSAYIKGVAYHSKLIDIRVSIDYNGTRVSSNDSVVRCLQAAIDKGAKVINISWSHPFAQVIEDKIKEALSKNIVVCCAAGNYYAANANRDVVFPAILAATTDVIAVAACGENNQIIDFNNTDGFGSCRGPAVTVMAPGRNIVTLDMSSDNYMSDFSGTSAATAFISGIAALLLAIDSAQTPAMIKNQLRTNGVANALDATVNALS